MVTKDVVLFAVIIAVILVLAVIGLLLILQSKRHDKFYDYRWKIFNEPEDKSTRKD